MSPTSLSKAHLAKLGYAVDDVERTIPHTVIKRDLFHMFDLLAIHPDSPETLGIQVTDRAHVNARVAKLKSNPLLKAWCQGDRSAWVHGWSEKGKAGKRKIWTLFEVPVTP